LTRKIEAEVATEEVLEMMETVAVAESQYFALMNLAVRRWSILSRIVMM